MKKFISGLIVGIMIMVSMSVFADSLNAKTNPFPVLVNGVRQAVDAYNINGSTYIKLSDVAKATEGAVNVKFDGESQVINISTMGQVGTVETAEVVEKTKEEEIAKPSGNERIEWYLKDDIMMFSYQGKEYGKMESVGYNMSITRGFKGASLRDDGSGNWFVLKEQSNPDTEILENAPYITINGWDYIEMDYYYNTILPFLE